MSAGCIAGTAIAAAPGRGIQSLEKCGLLAVPMRPKMRPLGRVDGALAPRSGALRRT
jgi:hypothetical protein